MTERTATTAVSLGSRNLPGRIGRDVEIFAVGDVHGRAAVLNDVLREIGALPKASGTERVLIFLGDLIDRGPGSIGAVNAAMAAGAMTGTDRVVMLPGNHELDFLDVLNGGDPALWFSNGGRAVMEEVDAGWSSRSWSDVLPDLAAAFPSDWIAAIRSAPSHLTIGDLLFVHAGIDPLADRAACPRAGQAARGHALGHDPQRVPDLDRGLKLGRCRQPRARRDRRRPRTYARGPHLPG